MGPVGGPRLSRAPIEIWESPCSRARLLLGDARLILPTLIDAGITALISDPPWGIRANTNYRRFTGGLTEHADFGPGIVGDDEPFDPRPWLIFPKVALWGAHCFAAHLPLGTWLCWVKKRESKLGKFLSDAELCWVKANRSTKSGPPGVYVRYHEWDGFMRASERGQTLHPTQKPVAIMRWTMERAKVTPGDKVCDPYMGAGATGVAAIQIGCSFIGVEISRDYFEISKRRIEEALATRAAS